MKAHLSMIIQFPNSSLKTDKEREYLCKYTSVNKNYLIYLIHLIYFIPIE